MKKMVYSLTPDELTAAVADLGQPRYRADQVRQWLYGKRVTAWDAMTNLPRDLRESLAGRFALERPAPVERQVSRDGTRKFLFALADGATIESVIIPMADHATFCISSQVGCAMACRFCATARGGLVRNLETGEIILQVLSLMDDLRDDPLPNVTAGHPNVVFMGMGEPLDNLDAVARSIGIMLDPRGLGLSRRRVRISTSGPGPGLRSLLASDLDVGLTLSLGGADDSARKAVMPVPGRTSVREVLDLAERYGKRTGRRGTVAWVLIAGRTDTPEQAEALGRLLARRPFKVNLIPLNPLDDDALQPAGHADTLAFQAILKRHGVDAFIRASGGRDIAAACGQLRRRRLG